MPIRESDLDFGGGGALTLREKGRGFADLHQRDKAFVIPNPWDVGSAKMLAALGFEALASSSAGYAFSVGRLDGEVNRDDMIKHVTQLASATNLPVSADLGNGFGRTLEAVAETYRMAGSAGLVGASIEDSTGNAGEPIYQHEAAVERVRAAAAAAHSQPFRFMLTARAENYLVGRSDLKDTIKRLQAYQDAGADVLYAPGLMTKEDITAVVSSVDRPVNVLLALKGMNFTVDELSDMGVKRISVGSGLFRAAMGGFLKAAREMREAGTFRFAEDSASSEEISSLLTQ